jgi:hypothetical protein
MIDSDEQEENDKKIRDFVMNFDPPTDLEKFIELYKSVGIELKPVVNEMDVKNGYQYLEISNDEYGTVTEKTTGYNGFYTRIYFDESGKFIQQGIWE